MEPDATPTPRLSHVLDGSASATYEPGVAPLFARFASQLRASEASFDLRTHKLAAARRGATNKDTPSLVARRLREAIDDAQAFLVASQKTADLASAELGRQALEAAAPPSSSRSDLGASVEAAARFMERIEREEAARDAARAGAEEEAAAPAPPPARAVVLEARPPPPSAPAPAPAAPAPAPAAPAPAPEGPPAPCPTLAVAAALERAKALGHRWEAAAAALAPAVDAWRAGGAAVKGPPALVAEACYAFARAVANVAVADGAHGAHSPALLDDAVAALDVGLFLGTEAHFPSRRLRGRLEHLRTRGPGLLVLSSSGRPRITTT